MYVLLFLGVLPEGVSAACYSPHIDFRNGTCLTPGGIDDFYSANLRCLNMGGFLPSILDNTDNGITGALARERLTGPGTWIGLDQRNHWVDDSDIVYANYREDLNITPENQSCTLLRADTGRWETQPCSNRLGFVCMIPADPENNECDLYQDYVKTPQKVDDESRCDPAKHCGNHWQVVTIMALNNETNFDRVIKRLDEQSTRCGSSDRSYYMSPSKYLMAPSSFGAEAFSPNYFSKQKTKYPLDNTLDNEEAGYIISDMLETTWSHFDKLDPLDGRGGIVNLFIDVNCSNLCNPAFNQNQSDFIFNMIAKGYYLRIFPYYGGQPDDTDEYDCAVHAFSQCSQYDKTNCKIYNSATDEDDDERITRMCIPYKFPTAAIVGISVGLAAILALILTFFYLRYQFKRHGKFSRFWKAMAGVGLSDLYGVETDEWELDKEELEIFVDKELGSGAFAVVYEGRLLGRRPVDELIPSAQLMADRKERVAVKRVPPHADKVAKQEFISEVNFMKKLGYHSHILGMIGCIVAADLPLMVLEYCDNGDLLNYVRRNREGFNLEGNGTLRPKDLLSLSWQISDGLCYLKTLDLIHRDLAARNILLTKDLSAKISDFGLCRQPEMSDSATIYVSRGGRLPVKWMAPESLRDFHFSFKTDVWSFGVTLWEMYTFGDVPFASTNPTNILETLEDGERLPQGAIPDAIYEVMMSCWAQKPEERKDVEDVKDKLNEILSSSSQYYGYVAISGCSVAGIGEGVEFDQEAVVQETKTEEEQPQQKRF